MSQPLNVVLVTFDTTRADRIGCYGYQHGLTDVLDQLAKRGVIFDSAFAPVPLTLPSHTTMLTGLYPPEHGLRVNGSGRLGNNVPLLSEILKNSGYDTGAFLAAFVLNSKFGLNRGFDVYDDDLSDSEPGEHSFDRRRTGVRVVDSALQWLEKRTNEPFFCWIHLYDAHAPYDAREGLFGDQFQDQPYDAGIAVEVQQLDRVLQFLESRQLQDRTIVVVVGDHGEGLGEHGEEEHGLLLYNTTVRVPMVVVAPQDCRPGHRVDEPVSLVDLTPTLLDMLGLPANDGMRGRSLKDSLAGMSIPPHPCYVETEAPFLDNRWAPMQAVVSDKWKYVYTTRGELFDLQNDPDERTNLWEVESDQRKELQAILEQMQDEFVPLSTGNVSLSDKDRQILASFGYIGGSTEGSAEAMATEALPDMKDMLPFQAKIDEVQKLKNAGQLDEALTLVREVVAATTPRYPMAEVMLGDLLQRQGAAEEAAAVYEALLKRQPECVKARSHLGDLHSSQGRWDQAAEEYRAVIRLESESSHAHFGLAHALSRMDRLAEAISEYKEAIRSDPGFVTAHFELAMLLARNGRLEDSIYYFQQALQYEPGLLEAHMNLSAILVQLNRIAEAVAHMEKAVELSPESFEAHVNLGNVLLMQKRINDAIQQFHEAQRLNPDDSALQERIRQIEAQTDALR